MTSDSRSVRCRAGIASAIAGTFGNPPSCARPPTSACRSGTAGNETSRSWTSASRISRSERSRRSNASSRIQPATGTGSPTYDYRPAYSIRLDSGWWTSRRGYRWRSTRVRPARRSRPRNARSWHCSTSAGPGPATPGYRYGSISRTQKHYRILSLKAKPLEPRTRYNLDTAERVTSLNTVNIIRRYFTEWQNPQKYNGIDASVDITYRNRRWNRARSLVPVTCLPCV